MSTELIKNVDKAMLVRLRSSMWGGATTDRTISNEVCDEKGIERDSGKWSTFLVSKKELDPLATAARKVVGVWKKWTLPWMDGGLRILNGVCFLDYSAEHRAALSEYNVVLDQLLAKYDSPSEATDLKREGQAKLDKLGTGKAMPPVEEVRRKFGISLTVLPVPQQTDFRGQLDGVDGEELKAKMEADLQECMKNAMGSAWQELLGVVEKMHETLADPDKRFQDRMIGKLKEVCQRLPKVLPVEDENLEASRQQALAKLSKLNPVHLRESKSERKAAAAEAKALIEKMKSYM